MPAHRHVQGGAAHKGMNKHLDLIVVGAGIVGLAHALMGARRGLNVAVIERDHRCNGASIRNFGFVTVTGQRAGDTWRRAMRSREVWAEVAPQAGIGILHQGLWVLARRPAALAVLQAFRATPMGTACSLVPPDEAGRRAPMLRTDGAAGALYSPHELRVESRTALPRLAAWLAERHGVRFEWGEAVLGVEVGDHGATVRTTRQSLQAPRVVLCPGTDLNGIARPFLTDFPDLMLTQLQMMRVRLRQPQRFGAAVMADLSLVRYAGYAALAEAATLRAQLRTERAASLDAGIHLIAVQSADGSLVVGDSHHDHPCPAPFASESVDRLILEELEEATTVGALDVVERWTGVYPTGHKEDALLLAPDPALRVSLVTSGTGASTAFGMAEDVFRNW